MDKPLNKTNFRLIENVYISINKFIDNSLTRKSHFIIIQLKRYHRDANFIIFFILMFLRLSYFTVQANTQIKGY